jgi:hypothetical protein
LSNDQFNKDGILVYPNPCNSDLQIDGISLSSYELVNSLGQIVKSSILDKTLETQKISVSELSNGVYFLRLSGLNGVFNKKIIVENK